MRVKAWLGLTVAAICGGPLPAQAELAADRSPGRLASLAAGIFCKDEVRSLMSEAPGTIRGTVERMDTAPRLAVETQTIPAVDGLMFGVLVREAVENGDVRITVTHPPLGPEGSTVEGWDTMMEPDLHTSHAYLLGLSDGNPVGRWTIDGAVDGDRLFYVEFDVVPPSPSVPDPCLYNPLS